MHLSEHEVLEVLAEPVCAVCALAARVGRTYLAGVIEGGINDPETRADWRRRGGLCRHHWGVARGLEAPALPLAILAEDLLEEGLKGRLPRPPRCPACAVEAEAEARYLAAIAALPEPQLFSALAAGKGFLCLDHLARLPEGKKKARFRARLEEILADLGVFQKKHDYRFAKEPMGRERDAWLRAVRALGGTV